MSEGTNNPVYKFMTDNRQLALINVLIRSIIEHKVLQSSLATSLMCDGIFNDKYVTKSLRSQTLK